MKKRFFNIVFIISLFLISIVGVKAYDKAKAPSTIPALDSKLYGTRSNDDKFDFSAISFKDGSSTLSGKNELYKIKLSDGYVNAGSYSKKLNNNWFSAYCLDPNLKYPIYGIGRRISESATEMPNDQNVFEAAVLAALFNSVNSNDMYNLFKRINEYSMDSDFEYTIPSEYESSETKYKDMLTAVLNGEEVKIGFKKYTRTDLVNSVSLTGSEINELLGKTGDEYEVSLTVENIYFDHYLTRNLGNTVNYNRVLWIIEHSYPTLSLSRLYSDAGVNEATLNSQLLALSGNDDLTNEEKIDGYIYSTVQYAIWKVLDIKIEGNTIGSTLEGSSELNKIYQYLIKDRSIYTNYGSKTFTSNISVTKPKGNEIYEETTESIKYGPYTITSDMISTGDITLSLNTNENVKIVDSNNNKISKVNENEKFYLVVNKTNKSNSIILTATATNGYTFEPSSNRGRIYYSVSPLVQNVVSGGIIKSASASVTLDILVNVNTGVPNIGLLFIVTLAIFTGGYFLIIKTNKKVELNN